MAKENLFDKLFTEATAPTTRRSGGNRLSRVANFIDQQEAPDLRGVVMFLAKEEFGEDLAFPDAEVAKKRIELYTKEVRTACGESKASINKQPGFGFAAELQNDGTILKTYPES